MPHNKCEYLWEDALLVGWLDLSDGRGFETGLSVLGTRFYCNCNLMFNVVQCLVKLLYRGGSIIPFPKVIEDLDFEEFGKDIDDAPLLTILCNIQTSGMTLKVH